MIEFILEYWLQLMLTVLTTGFLAMGGMVLALFSGVRALLRDRIIYAYNHYYLDKECLPIYAIENVERMYKAYHALHGNGTVTQLVEKMRTLPQMCEEGEKVND